MSAEYVIRHLRWVIATVVDSRRDQLPRVFQLRVERALHPSGVFDLAFVKGIAHLEVAASACLR